MHKKLPTVLSCPTAMHQLGHYIILFQNLERLLNEVLIQAASLDDREIVKILVHEHDFGKRVSTADVLFSHVVRTQFPSKLAYVKEFHDLAEDVVRLSKRRNELVHSRYAHWMNIDGQEGLVRSNSKFKTSRGARLDIDEDLLPESFVNDHQDVRAVIRRLERFRVLLIDWHIPIEP